MLSTMKSFFCYQWLKLQLLQIFFLHLILNIWFDYSFMWSLHWRVIDLFLQLLGRICNIIFFSPFFSFKKSRKDSLWWFSLFFYWFLLFWTIMFFCDGYIFLDFWYYFVVFIKVARFLFTVIIRLLDMATKTKN